VTRPLFCITLPLWMMILQIGFPTDGIIWDLHNGQALLVRNVYVTSNFSWVYTNFDSHQQNAHKRIIPCHNLVFQNIPCAYYLRHDVVNSAIIRGPIFFNLLSKWMLHIPTPLPLSCFNAIMIGVNGLA
jgi:hypothetical protein